MLCGALWKSLQYLDRVSDLLFKVGEEAWYLISDKQKVLDKFLSQGCRGLAARSL